MSKYPSITPCPVCGECKDFYIMYPEDLIDNNSYAIKCGNCGRIGDYGKNKAEAIVKWNGEERDEDK